VSVELLNLYEKATLPLHFTGLDRHLLEHYCNKHIDDLGKAILPMKDLVRIFNVSDKSLLRSRKRLIEAGALTQVTKGFPNQASEFSVSRHFLIAHQQVTDELPVSRNKSPQRNRQVASQHPTGDASVTNASPSSNPIQEYKNTKQQVCSDYVIMFNNFISNELPPTKQFKADPKLVIVLDSLSAKGFSFKAIASALEAIGQPTIDNPKMFALKRLQTLLEAQPDWNMTDNKPPYCGECDPETRQVNYRYEIPSTPQGLTVNECPKCNPYALRRLSA
jgi:hypothetical protein